MNAPRVDRWGDPIEDDLTDVVASGPRQSVRQHITDLRRILAESRQRRESNQ